VREFTHNKFKLAQDKRTTRTGDW